MESTGNILKIIPSFGLDIICIYGIMYLNIKGEYTMKVFKYDFNTGKRGECIDNFIHFGNGQRIGICKKSGMEVYEYIDSVDNCITADDYIEDAICCCIGKTNNKWEWIIIPNKDLSKKAIERNKKLFGTEYFDMGVTK